ncbi:hypothetical protein [Microvirga sp. KLBC 81]|uniref:hypothetical protein n=1 Tax=Microvirga sp. KLBC 81 TaxID=1862707 RepID=UPI001403D766|nr:hypothetical protein [Microvirga sp. KLBC 81]
MAYIPTPIVPQDSSLFISATAVTAVATPAAIPIAVVAATAVAVAAVASAAPVAIAVVAVVAASTSSAAVAPRACGRPAGESATDRSVRLLPLGCKLSASRRDGDQRRARDQAEQKRILNHCRAGIIPNDMLPEPPPWPHSCLLSMLSNY